MASEDYAAVTRGGLKFKGVAGTKVQKPKKKKKRPKDATDAGPAEEYTEDAGNKEARQERPDLEAEAGQAQKGDVAEVEGEGEGSAAALEREKARVSTMTEAEKRHDERRRKKLDERIKREGIKTHKERVEQLNRYLSNLSEHNDMPRIGPG